MTHYHRILELLYDRQDGYYLLDELGEEAGIARPALAAAMDELRRRGYELELTPAHGVRLVRPVRPDGRLVERALGTRRVGRSVICFDEVDSTNDVAFDSARRDGADGLVVLAESQRRGRGRLGRRWIAPPAAGLLFSVVLADAERLACEALTVGTGLAVAEGIEAACALACRLRWPNDVLLGDGKVAGVLVEVRHLAGRRCVVLGVGINVNAHSPAGRVDRPATSLAEHLGHPAERIEVLRAVLRRLDARVGQVAAGELDDLHAGWLARCDMINERLTVESAARRYVGRVSDIDPLEGLILFDDNGRRIHLPAEHSTIVEG